MDYVYNSVNDMIVHISTNKKFHAIIKDPFFRYRKLDICLVFITQSYFSVPSEVRLNSAHYLIMQIHIKRDPQHIGISHSADTDYKDFIEIYRKCTRRPYSF